jgi:hypothetical protein
VQAAADLAKAASVENGASAAQNMFHDSAENKTPTFQADLTKDSGEKSQKTLS